VQDDVLVGDGVGPAGVAGEVGDGKGHTVDVLRTSCGDDLLDPLAAIERAHRCAHVVAVCQQAEEDVATEVAGSAGHQDAAHRSAFVRGPSSWIARASAASSAVSRAAQSRTLPSR
jgi:hypothetical protein